MSFCIQYNFRPSGETANEIFGLDVAINNLVSAWFRYGSQEKYICRTYHDACLTQFKNLATAAGIDADACCIGIDARAPQHNLSTISTLFRPDPAIGEHIWQRQQIAGRGFATCGLVHTLSGSDVTQAIAQLCLVPSDETDVLICPSLAISKAVHAIWDIYTDYLNHRFKSSFACAVQTPIIPIGIDTDKFARLTTADKRQNQRKNLGVADDEIIILFVGRLSHATKAHPLPLMAAAEQAAKCTKRKLRLVFFGYFKPVEMEADFTNLAKTYCEAVCCDFIKNDDARFPDGLWAAADIFTSLVENIQESYGLTPIEAMASGLPCVISDWDGYRDGVRHGQDGFLIPTALPPAPAGMDLAQNYYNTQNYGFYLISSSQSTSIDIRAAASAFVTLAEDDALRRTMGASGRARAQTDYDWRTIIPTYEQIWTEQSIMRRMRKMTPPVPENWPAHHPDYPNPWALFASFPSKVIEPTDCIRVAAAPKKLADLVKLNLELSLTDLVFNQTAFMALLATIQNIGKPTLGSLLQSYPPHAHALFWRSIGWLLKHDICVLETSA